MASAWERLRSIGALVGLNGFLPMRRQPLFLVNTLTSPFSFLFLYFIVEKAAGNTHLFPYAIAGGLILTVLSIGTSLQADLTHYKQDLKFQEIVVASPVGAASYVTGMALSELVYSIPGLAVFIILSVLYAHYAAFGGLTVLLALLLLWVFASALGFTLSTYLEDVRETFAISPLVSIALSVIPPVYYPITVIPGAWRWVALLSPTTWAANLVQGAMGLPAPSLGPDPYLLDATVLLAWAVALFLLAWTKAQWRER